MKFPKNCTRQSYSLLILATILISPNTYATEKTNIVFLLADDLGTADFSPEFMPRSYKIMQEMGTTMPLYSMQNCAPTRTAIMTGKQPAVFGITGVDSAPAYAGIPTNETMISELVQAEGYATGIFGKWHLGLTKAQSPLNNGFDEFIGLTHGWINSYGTNRNGQPYPDGTIGHDHHGSHDFQFNGIPFYSSSYSTFVFRDSTIEFIERNAELQKPFFAYVAFNARHGPHSAPRKYVEELANRFDINSAQLSLLYEFEDTVLGVPKNYSASLSLEYRLTELLYYASLRALDDAIADIFEALVTTGEIDNTLFLFASDNGGAAVPSRGRHGDNGALRGGKGTPYEGGHKVANFLVWKNNIPTNHPIGINVWIGDLYETFAAVAGTTVPDYNIESNNVLQAIISGQSSFTRKHGGQHIISHISKSLRDEVVLATLAINNAHQKYIRYVTFDATTNLQLSIHEELFDLAKDPGESTNLIADPIYQPLAERMVRKYERYGGDAFLQSLRTTVRSDWTNFSIPNEWGFPGKTFNEDQLLKSNLF